MRLPSSLDILLARQAVGGVGVDNNAPPPDLTTLPENSLFETWRPKIHVLPPNGQIGDPCAHYNDPATGLFHVGFLHNGTGISSVYTDDLVTYRDINPNGGYIIVAGGPNDPEAVFDGSVIPSGIDNLPTLLYTSVTSLPIHWTLPYTRGSETQSLAVSDDGGHQFDKLDRGPVIPAPPEGLDVTAFRDPFVFQNHKLDEAAGSNPDTWYAAISGGVKDVGPGIFLYRNQDPSFENWEYLGEWWQEPANSTWGDGTWAKRWGYNFETGNVFSLDREGYNVDGHTFITIGVEGAYAPIEPSVTSMHAMLWAAGDVSSGNGENVSFTPYMAGALDWGTAAYAGAGKVLPSTSQASQKSGAPNRFISWVWLTGDEFGAAAGFPAAQQGWQNTLLLPRELSIHTIPNVVDNELVHETASWRVVENDGERKSGVELETLGINIARETYDAIISSSTSFEEPPRDISASDIIPFERSPTSRFFALEAQISFPKSARDSGVQSGFQILASELEWTTIYYQFSNESIVIDRNHTSAASETTPGLGTVTESGRIRLFDIAGRCDDDGHGNDGHDGGHDDGHNGEGDHNGDGDHNDDGDHNGDEQKGDDHNEDGNGDGKEHARYQKRNGSCDKGHDEIETLDLTIVVDNSVLEVYANSRFVVSTWVRPWYTNSTEIRFFHNGEGEVSFGNITVHDGLYDAYPDRAN